ncbi:hypothetical protein DPMN_077006 [Dreissena polymorpha]|uniref:Uncharacterized protein n=1 Tax=Dreissena polymorpha TaxID=45954 RepID=A0A9D3YJP4_DREPO|nr:hypothetical protein DPMN_077006 [Dreissena polymorpha]
MAGFNAFGEYRPQIILLPAERIRDIGLLGFLEATYTATPNGWMDSEAFESFLHSTHMALEAVEFYEQNRIILYCLLPNATHILQAADLGLFSPMKFACSEAMADAECWPSHDTEGLYGCVFRHMEATRHFSKCGKWLPTIWIVSTNCGWY